MNDQKRSRIAVTAIFAVHGAVPGAFATRIPWIQTRHHLGPTALGIALIAPAIAACFTMPMTGYVMRRVGTRRSIRWLSVSLSFTLALPALAPSLPLLWLALLAYGAMAGITDVAMNANGVEVERRIGRSIMSGLHGSWSAGGLIASGLGAFAAYIHLDPRIHLSITAVALALLSAVSGSWLLDAQPDAVHEKSRGFAWPTRSIIAVGMVGFFAQFAQGAAGNWSAVYLRDIARSSAGVAAASYTGFSCTMGLMRLVGDLLVRRFGAVRTVRYSGSLAVLGGVLIVTARSAIPAITGFALLGVGIAVVVPLAFAAAGQDDVDQSRSLASVASITYLSNLLAPAAIGAVAGASSLPVAFFLITLMLLCMVVSASALRSRRAQIVAPTTIEGQFGLPEAAHFGAPPPHGEG